MKNILELGNASELTLGWGNTPSETGASGVRPHSGIWPDGYPKTK